MLGQLTSAVAVALLVPVLSTQAAACALVATSGTLSLSPDGTVYSSELGLGSLLTVTTTVLDGPITVTIDPPTLDESPTGFSLGSLQQKTTVTVGTLDLNFDYTSGAIHRAFPTQLAGISVVALHHRLTASRFPSGTYRTRTVATCS